MNRRSASRVWLPLLATAAAGALIASVTTLSPAGAAPMQRRDLHRPLRLESHVKNTMSHGLPRALEQGTAGLPATVPNHGRYAFLLRLNRASTLTAYRQNATRGKSTAAAVARTQYARIKALQTDVINALPGGSRVLYKAHSVLAGVAVMTDVHNYGAMHSIRGVQAVYPISPKSVSNSYAMPLQHAPQAWQAHGDLGANSTIAIIDTGVDYTHANLGGSGVPADYTAAKNNDAKPVDTSAYDHNKFDDSPGPKALPVGFHDFVGDTYNADPTDPDYQPVPHPDANPLDCDGHGSHVAGIAAGYGENPDGTTYNHDPSDYTSLGSLSTSAYQDTFRIGPGMAPLAHLLAYKVFGCAGSTDVVGKAIDRAADPNQDGDPSDHVDVINMSLGSDYGSPQDGDSVASNMASKLGITVVTAAGNGGDFYDVGGSPGNAVRTIDVAASQDNYSQVDSLHVSFNGTPQPSMAAERSVLYDWANDPDLVGEVYKLTKANNLTACSPLTGADLNGVKGKVAFVPQWHDAAPECSSIQRATNLKNAGATGFIFGSDSEVFSAGINGSAAIPCVLISKSAATDLANGLATAPPVVVTSTSANDFPQLVAGVNDTLASFSSRGTRFAGNVKPDVTAVGGTVFSTGMGTGNEGLNDSGTSMATPMVAGLAALVKSMRAGWKPEQVKADIMNTAGQDLFSGKSHRGNTFAPNRVGAGRIEADRALDNRVLAYNASDSGAVSVSFGPVAVTGKTTLTKKVKVVNKSARAASFTVGYHGITTVPGVKYVLSVSSLKVSAGRSKTFSVKFIVTRPGQLTKTRDATVARRINEGTDSNGKPILLPREFLADASGRITLSPAGSYPGPALRVPVYSAPRPASRMSQPHTVALPGSGVQFGRMRLSGHGVNQGSGSTKIRSFDAGFELQATSGLAPTCKRAGAEGCVHFPNERSADLKYVGFSSDSPLVKALGSPPIQDGQAYFAITTQRPWRTPVGPQEFDILIDTNGDNRPDAVIYNTRLRAEDIFLSEFLDITHRNNPCIRDDELINDRLGDTDTALFDSDTMLLPMWPAKLGKVQNAPCFNGGTRDLPALPKWSSTHTRIHYGVQAYGNLGELVDSAGISRRGHLTLTTDVIHPGVEAVGFPGVLNSPTIGLVFNPDQPGKVLTARRDVARYNADHGKGLLMVHFQNKVGAKAQRVTLKSKPKVTIKLSTSSVPLHNTLHVTVRVANTAGHRPTGKVTLRRANGSVVKGAMLRRGKRTFSLVANSRGTFKLHATYGGDANYVSGASKSVSYKVT
ncbi:MAG TPA: S8 family serine peptidase [Jatrophihabitans sp.]|nr:S8 family serine peptidase [Jatrophihabitans sp.]